MATSGTAKVCVVCGDDCASKPRTKDNRGRYYCKGCYDKATAARPKPSPALVLPDAPIAEPAHFLDELVSAAPPPVASIPCAQCGYAVRQGSFICTHCGFNAQTGRVMKAKIMKVRTESTNPGAVWSPIVGITSALFGTGGVLLYGLTLLSALIGATKPGAFVPSLFTTIPLTCLFTSLSAWLLRDGIRIIRKDSEGVKWIRFWAMAKLLLFGSCLAMFMSIPGRALDEGLARAQTGGMHITASDVKASILLVLSWFMFWPVFVMIFFFVPRIQNDVERWG